LSIQIFMILPQYGFTCYLPVNVIFLSDHFYSAGKRQSERNREGKR
jgi:hypothetical protein